MQASVSVVVPVYNEEVSLGTSLARLGEVLQDHFSNFEVVLVSDGSTDRSTEVARALGCPWLTILEYHPNRGKGFALQTGFQRTRGHIVVFFDGDLDIHPNAIPVLVEMLQFQNAHSVVGSKQHPNSNVEYPRVRRVQSIVFSRLVSMLFDLHVHDTQTGVKVFLRSALEPHLAEVSTAGFAFDLELLARMSRAGLRIIEGPVEIDYRFDSRISLIEPLRMVRDMFRIRRNLADVVPRIIE